MYCVLMHSKLRHKGMHRQGNKTDTNPSRETQTELHPTVSLDSLKRFCTISVFFIFTLKN